MFNWEAFFWTIGGSVSAVVFFLLCLLSSFLCSEGKYVLSALSAASAVIGVAILIGFVG